MSWVIPKASPSPSCLWKNCLPWNQFLVPERLGTVALNESSYVFLNWPQHLPPPHSFPSLYNGIPSITLLKIRNWGIIGHFCLILSFQSKILSILSLHVSSILFLHCNVIITNLVQAQIILNWITPVSLSWKPIMCPMLLTFTEATTWALISKHQSLSDQLRLQIMCTFNLLSSLKSCSLLSHSRLLAKAWFNSTLFICLLKHLSQWNTCSIFFEINDTEYVSLINNIYVTL